MAKPNSVMIGDTTVRPMSDERSWARMPGTMIAGRSHIDGMDETASEMEAKWGADRLRLLVPAEWREKFDRQRYLTNQAIWHGDLEQVRRETGRMTAAWFKLDALATEAGKAPLASQVWEIPLADGSVAALVPTHEHAHLVAAEDRQLAVYTLEEIARLLSAYPDLAKAKLTFPGATITAVRRQVDDPLDSVHDTSASLDDEMPDFS